MFSKEKGKTWKITNGILFITLIGYIITLLVSIISELLPENGDYSNFVINEFMNNFLNNISIILIIGLTLFLINKKLNLFDKNYAFSRKFLNLLFIFTIMGSIIYLITHILNLIFNQNTFITYSGLVIKNTIATALVYALALYFVNFKPIMIKENSKSQNFFNYISVCFCIGALYSFVLSILNVETFGHPVDFLRTIIIELIIFGIFAFVIYWINFKKKNNENDIPEAFNIDK